ncbi:MAG: transposase [Actinomycetes bacterium]
MLTLDQRSSRSRADEVPRLLGSLAGPPLRVLLPFERTVGDEVQGVLADPEDAVEAVARVLRMGGWNIGIGLGEVEEPLPTSTREGRGTAYLRARDAVTRAKSAPHRLTVVGAVRDPDAEALETVLGLWAGVLERRSDRGWEVHDLVARGHTHAEVAVRLGISTSAVSQRAQAAGLVDDERARRLAARLWSTLLTEGRRPS